MREFVLLGVWLEGNGAVRLGAYVGVSSAMSIVVHRFLSIMSLSSLAHGMDRKVRASNLLDLHASPPQADMMDKFRWTLMDIGMSER